MKPSTGRQLTTLCILQCVALTLENKIVFISTTLLVIVVLLEQSYNASLFPNPCFVLILPYKIQQLQRQTLKRSLSPYEWIALHSRINTLQGMRQVFDKPVSFKHF